ncbi:MAG: diaminopimelate decarboxylase [Firmicutes bacterium]|nr:diaminopimelate decarboxylase [Bacillota bacterium]
MSEKKLPVSGEKIAAIAERFGTPFHLYDEKAIRANVREFLQAFAWAPAFKEYFAVKALPNPYILQILAEEGVGADCSSMAELYLSEAVGLKNEDICFTSNDTPMQEYEKAKALGAIINFDDISHIDGVDQALGLPSFVSMRYNPGPLRQGGNTIIGYPEEAKYGMTDAQILQAVADCQKRGVSRFGLHTMIVSNELNIDYLIETAEMMFQLAARVKEALGVSVEVINLGGGIGIPYQPEQQRVDLPRLGREIEQAYRRILVPAGLGQVKLAMESGRMITGPYGYLVAKAIHYKDTYKQYIGLDACMADLMRPALYGAYHHITVVGKEDRPCDHVYDVTGSLCENNDKFAINRSLPKIDMGDLLVIHDTGAHGHAMGFNYNGKLRSQELLLTESGQVKQIRRAETLADYFATLDYPGLPQRGQ